MKDIDTKIDYGLTIGLGPVNMGINLPLEKWMKTLWSALDKNIASLSLDFIQWCLQRILSDRLDEPDVHGAWGKSNVHFLRFVYGEEEIPNDISSKDSITITSRIICALAGFNSLLPKAEQEKITPYIEGARLYLLSRHDHRSGGFGLKVKTLTRESRIAPDLRHTVYAIIALTTLHQNPEEVIKGIKYVSEELTKIDLFSERAITLSSLHFLLTSSLTKELVSEIILDSEKWKMRIETELINKFDPVFASWDLYTDNKDRAKRMRIANALFVLLNLDEQNISSENLKSICTLAVRQLLSKDTHALDNQNKQRGLRFFEGGNPDIGVTLQFLDLILKNKNLYKPPKHVI
ncbi:MAG: hypothetical protein QW838_08245 [Candidatus Nitrosotenuis sp.]